MKKILICLILLLTCALVLAGCEDERLTKTPTFSQALERNGFVANASQGNFLDRLDEWIYEGQVLSELGHGMHWDSYNGGGYDFSADDVCYFPTRLK